MKKAIPSIASEWGVQKALIVVGGAIAYVLVFPLREFLISKIWNSSAKNK